MPIKTAKEYIKNIGSNIFWGKENFLIHLTKTMPKFENAPNLNNPELNPSEPEAGVNVEKKPEGELTPEEMEKLKAEEEKETEKPELSPEEQLKNLESEAEAKPEVPEGEIKQEPNSIEGGNIENPKT